MNRLTRHTAAIIAIAATICLLYPEASLGYSSGPPDAATGAPGESTCGVAGCHGNLNIGSGSVSLTTPAEYRPGDTVEIIVNLQMLGQKRWGFEATVLNSQNQPVGAILRTDSARTQISVATSGRQYIKHTTVGTDAGTLDQAPGWSFRWVTPAGGTGPVTFYVAGNAANNSLTNFGDYIYTGSSQVTEAVGTAVGDESFAVLPHQVRLEPNYPNPFNPSTTIGYTLPRGEEVRLTVYNTLGRTVRTLIDGFRSAGDHTVEWDGRDDDGGEVASGIYLYSLVSGRSATTRKMVLLR